MTKRFLILFITLSTWLAASAEWTSYLAYNQVSRIAVAENVVYALSNGALFSVDKVSEHIEKIDIQSGLHSTGLTALHYDATHQQLLLFYNSGKIDVLSGKGVKYVSGLYDKDIKSDKHIFNVTEYNGFAYLATSFGILTMNMAELTLVDTYIIGDEAKEIAVQDICFQGDSIYAFTDKYVAAASLTDNMVDYRVWRRIPADKCPVKRDSNKGVKITDTNGDIWQAGGTKGVIRTSKTGSTSYYKPDGPISNNPYYIAGRDGYVYVVPGGYWGTQNFEPALVNYYSGNRWHSVSNADINSACGFKAYDLSFVAIDPKDPRHYFVSSYGAGLLEFYDNRVVKLYNQDNSTITPAVKSNPSGYTRAAGIDFDPAGNMYVMVAHQNAIHTVAIRTTDGQWGGINLRVENDIMKLESPRDIHVDRRNPNHKWIIHCRQTPGILVLDDNGTILDDTDDQVVFRNIWLDQDNNIITFDSYYTLFEASTGDIWIGTSTGPIRIPAKNDIMTSNNCMRLRLPDGDMYLMDNQEIRSITEDKDGNIWLATSSMGVYVLSADGTELIAHYTTDNSSMPSNMVFSLYWDPTREMMFIGTAEGLVATGEHLPIPGGLEPGNNNDPEDATYGNMFQWTLHPSSSTMQNVVVARDCIYGLASGTLFAVDKQTEDITAYSRLNGLNGGEINHIAYNNATDQLMVIYANGMIDLISKQGITCLLDIYNKAATMPTTVQDVVMHNHMAYLAMPFGIIAYNLRKKEVTDTYYIGDEASDVDIQCITVSADSIYASSYKNLYSASLSDNLIDYHNWTCQTAYFPDTISALGWHNNALYALGNTHHLYVHRSTGIQPISPAQQFNWVRFTENRIIADIANQGPAVLQDGATWTPINTTLPTIDIDYDATTANYWAAVPQRGLVRLQDNQTFAVNGPISNNAWEMTFVGNRLFASPGGRWGSQFKRKGDLSIYENGVWKGFPADDITRQTTWPWLDIVSVAGDPNDPTNFWVASYGMGIMEYKNDRLTNHYVQSNSTLRSAVKEIPVFIQDEAYIRTDGLHLDNDGNLWVLNAGVNVNTINVKSPAGRWYAYDIIVNGKRLPIETPGDILPDRRDPRYKWIPIVRQDVSLLLHFDNGTPYMGSDDRTVKRNYFFDQDGLQVTMDAIMCLTQDRNNDLWMGTSHGIIIVPSAIKLEDFANNNTCVRVKIPRNDGTNLADYLLGTEQVNCIAVDGGNRKWIGTESSGLYLVSADGLETLAHFTTDNSPLPADNVLSIAIHPTTGEVFIGTSSGMASFRSDASEPQETYDNVYAYPNPVRPNYYGVITITGLMDNSFVTIIDGGGNVVCKTQSQGGTAIWDGKLPNGQRAATGVYTVLCNSGETNQHTVTKILFVN